MPSRTLGIDLATRPEKTAACMLRWPAKPGAPAQVELLASGLDDDRLRELMIGADLTGIDAPIGWPDPFVKAVSAWREGKRWKGAESSELQQRTTDSFCAATLGELAREREVRVPNRPLSVSADMIAATAMRAAGLLSAAEREDGLRIDRSGTRGSRACEVYPAAALFVWELPSTGYKGTRGADERAKLVRALGRKLKGIVDLTPGHRAACRESDDVLDALVASIATRAAQRKLTHRPKGKGTKSIARREGWIHFPVPGSLDDLGPGD